MRVETVTFDYFDPEVQGPRYWEALRSLAAHGPLVWVDSGGGFWAATGHEVVLAIAQNWTAFSSAQGVAHPTTRTCIRTVHRSLALTL